jgi:hypothetical protein
VIFVSWTDSVPAEQRYLLDALVSGGLENHTLEMDVHTISNHH